MKKFLALSFLIPTILCPSAFADEFSNEDKERGPYVSLGAGIGFPQDQNAAGTVNGVTFTATQSYSSVLAGGIGVGYDFGDIRVETAFSHQKMDYGDLNFNGVNYATSGDISANNFSIAGYKDFSTNSKISPYIGLGLGISSQSAHTYNLTIGGTTTSVAVPSDSAGFWGIKGGFSYPVSSNNELYAGISYTDALSDPALPAGYTSLDSGGTFGLSLGTRIKF